jgi:hypothetical protein
MIVQSIASREEGQEQMFLLWLKIDMVSEKIANGRLMCHASKDAIS